MRSILLLACLTCPALLFAQTNFRNQYSQGVDFNATTFIAEDVEKTSSGYILAGQNVGAALMATNDAGEPVWLKKYTIADGLGIAHVKAVAVLPDGGYLIGGEAPVLFVARVSQIGDVIWAKAAVGTVNLVNQIILTSDGNFMLAGMWTDNAFNGLLVKGDLNGNILWANSYSTNAVISEDFRSVVETPDGGFIGYGSWNNQTMNDDLYAVKVDATGAVVWSNIYGNTPTFTFAMGDQIRPAGDGNYIITGSIDVKFSNAGAPLVGKIDANGNVLWCKKLEPLTVSFGFSGLLVDVAVMADESICVMSASGSRMIRITRLDKDGTPQSSTFYDDPSKSSVLRNFTALQDGSFAIVGGQFDPSLNMNVGSFFKTDATGATSCSDSLANETTTTFDLPITQMPTTATPIPALNANTPTVAEVMMGVTNLCGTQSANDPRKTIPSLAVYPNPSIGTASISLASASDFPGSMLELLDMTGKQVALYPAAALVTIKQGLLPAGTYMVRWTSDGFLISESKLIFK